MKQSLEGMKNSVNYNEIKQLIADAKNPVILSFSDLNGKIISTPIWIHESADKFYYFTGRKAMKYRTLLAGNTQVSLLIVNSSQFPHVKDLGYLSFTGTASVKTATDINAAEIQIELLRKYRQDADDEYKKWLDGLINDLTKKPEDAWLVEIIPDALFMYK